jgi:Flp pilus assembly protein TadG
MILRRQTRQRPATTLVEMAFVALVCFFFLFAIFEYGRYVFVRQIMENAARSGARVAVVEPTSYVSDDTANDDVGNAITTALAGGTQIQNMTWTAFQADSSGNNTGDWTAAQFGKNIVVQIDADMTLLFPLLNFIQPSSPNTIHITVKVMMRSEAN